MLNDRPDRSLRRRLRSARRGLPRNEQRDHAKRLARHLGTDLRFKLTGRIAAYVAGDGEIDPEPLLQVAHRRGRRLFLPVLRPGRGRALWFARDQTDEPKARNRFAIAEPALRRGKRLVTAKRLDLILLPLVGFDTDCHRLGMGGGFYDRTLAFLKHRRCWQRPRLIGLAHACQRVDRIDSRPWDVPLDAVVSEVGIYRCRSTPTEVVQGREPANNS